jgi:hypothetical protein
MNRETERPRMTPTSAEHIEPEAIAAYLDRGLSAEERQAVERHLLVCGECRRDLAEAADLGSARRPRRWVMVGIPAAAAAVLALVIFGPLQSPGIRNPDRPTVRGEQAEGTRSFAPVAPIDGAELAVDSIAFSWRSEGPGVHYLLTLTDENGDIVWSTGTADTSLSLPREVGLQPGQRYYWYADALLQGARSSTTGILEFRVRP